MSIEEIVNKAIPISFPGVNCAAMIGIEREKALLRRAQLTKEITTLLENQQHGNISRDQLGVDRGAY